MKRLVLSVLCFAMSLENFAQTIIKQLKELPPLYGIYENGHKKDWMLHEEEVKANLFKNKEGQLVLSNGLISRTFSITPNMATIDFRNLMTGEAIIRSVREETLLEIDGISIEVGGLKGQPIHNYLKKEWVKNLVSNPAAFKAVDFKVGEIKERFEWKKRHEWMPTDLPWPPSGKELVVEYELDENGLSTLQKDQNSDFNRSLLFSDDFTQLKDVWDLNVTDAHDRSSFINEGKAGEIYTPMNTSTYAEIDTPKDGEVFVLEVNPGTDTSSSHGLGMVLVFENKLVRMAFKGSDKFIVSDGENETTINRKPSTRYFLRMEIREGKIICKISKTQKTWQLAGEVAMDKNNRPTKVRIGKMDSKGAFKDASNRGKLSRSKVESFTILGSEKPVNNGLDYLKHVEVKVHYELYDGLPLLCKWISIKNRSKNSIRLNTFTSELLTYVEPKTYQDSRKSWKLPNITVQTDHDAGGGMYAEIGVGKNYRWKPDELYSSIVDYGRTNPTILEVKPEYGPDQIIKTGEDFESYRVWELIHDSWEMERKGLQVRKMFRTISPWVTENPIMMHLVKKDSEYVKAAIDQAAEVGFEMVILSFGSGANLEDDSPKNIAQMKKLSDYAHSKGIALGGYSLLASRSVGKAYDVVSPIGTRPRFGSSPCLGSTWGQEYLEKLYQFYKKTGHDIFEHDGSYPGDVCASTTHTGHKGLQDSHWNQFKAIAKFYRWCRANGIYLNIPDWYFLNGGSKVGMGYKEVNWSLPRKQQEIIERQNIYDGTWDKTPSMGWMHVPLRQYHGGGEVATYEPLNKNLGDYEARLANLFGLGVQAAWRGERLYDTEVTKKVVKKWVNFYKKHRAILDSDLIHVRRADGKDYDAILHVNPNLEEKGLLMVYNPLDEPIKKEIKANLYYTGIQHKALFIEQEEKLKEYRLDEQGNAWIKISVPANSRTWYVIKSR